MFSYPEYLCLFKRGLEVWYSEPAVTTPILKLMAELVLNRSQRLNFDVTSANGLLLFKEASNVICAYGNPLLILI